MRARGNADDHLSELTRRRLDALLAELAGEPPPQQGQAPTPDAGPQPARDEEVEDLTGRHARRPLSWFARTGGWVEDRLPPGLQSRLHLGAAHVGVIALVAALGVLLAAWGWVRSAGSEVEGVAVPAREPAAVVAESDAAPSVPTLGAPVSPAAAGATSPSGGEVVVDVEGKVGRPGIVVLPVGSRVSDAVKAAGGFRPGRASYPGLNLARVLVDGEQIVVGRIPGGPAPAAAQSSGSAGTGTTSGGTVVSINTADQTLLETLPGVGPVTATAIIQWREEHGSFTAVEELLEVSGIGDVTLETLRPFVTL